LKFRKLLTILTEDLHSNWQIRYLIAHLWP